MKIKKRVMIRKEPTQMSPQSTWREAQSAQRKLQGCLGTKPGSPEQTDSGYQPLRAQHIPVLYRTTSHHKAQTPKYVKSKLQNTCRNIVMSRAPALLQELLLSRGMAQDKIGQCVGAGLHKHGVLSPCVI